MTEGSFRASATIRRDLPRLDDRRGQAHPGDAGGDHRLGLRDRRHRDAPAPAANWRRATSGHLCVLACGRSAHPRAAAVLRHLRDIGLKPVEVHEQRRGRQVGLAPDPRDLVDRPLPARPDAGKPDDPSPTAPSPIAPEAQEAATIPGCHGCDPRQFVRSCDFDADFMIPAVIDQRDHRLGLGLAVEPDGRLARLEAPGVLDGDPVRR